MAKKFLTVWNRIRRRRIAPERLVTGTSLPLQSTSSNIATAAIIREGPSVLLARRKTGQMLSGYWEFPGGKMEPGETIQTCLAREIFEELEVTVEVGEIVASNEHSYGRGFFTLVALEAKVTGGTMVLTVHDKMVWSPVNLLLDYQLAPAGIPIARALQSKYTNEMDQLIRD